MDRYQQGGIAALPPVYARMFQQMSEAMLAFSEAMKIVETPIPFPYTQMNAMVLYAFGVTWPVMCAVMVPQIAYAALLAFLVVLACFSIDAIATELQDPFGNDDNDLPLREIMRKFEYEVESILVLNGMATNHHDIKGFRSILTKDDADSSSNMDVGASPGSDSEGLVGAFQPRSNGPTRLFQAQCVQPRTENTEEGSSHSEKLAAQLPRSREGLREEANSLCGGGVVAPAEISLQTKSHTSSALPSMGSVYGHTTAEQENESEEESEEEDEEEDEEETETASEEDEGDEAQLDSRRKIGALHV